MVVNFKQSHTRATLNNGATEEVWEQINAEVWKLISSNGEVIGRKMSNDNFKKYVERFKKNLS